MERADFAGDDRGLSGLLGGVLRILMRLRGLSMDPERGAVREGDSGSGVFVAAGECTAASERVWTCGGLSDRSMGIGYTCGTWDTTE